MTFRKRTFKSVGRAASDLAALVQGRREMAEMMVGTEDLSPALREKIMLAVTSVNKCRYCSAVHSKLALREGLTAEEVDAILRGDFDDVSPEEREVLLYAQHWAETSGHPDAAVRQRVVETYGAKRTALFEAAIRAIMFGNYFGNGFDSILDKVTAGRLTTDTVND